MIDIEIFATTNRIRCAIEALGSITGHANALSQIEFC